MSDLANQDSTTESTKELLEEDRKSRIYYKFSKRMLDILGSIFGLAILMILLLIVSLLIKLEDPKGPVFFSQKRVGKYGKEFKMYKFRSMVTDAEEKLEGLLKYNEVDGAMFKMKDDPRVTKVGRFIRKTSIDELPQLFNVLKGEMSLVGPRPPLPREVKEYTNYHMQRLLVTPGCTGIWQVNARNSVGFEEMVEMDLYYIQNRSFMFDLRIIVQTVAALFGSKNAF